MNNKNYTITPSNYTMLCSAMLVYYASVVTRHRIKLHSAAPPGLTLSSRNPRLHFLSPSFSSFNYLTATGTAALILSSRQLLPCGPARLSAPAISRQLRV